MYRQYVQSGIAPGANTVTTSAIAANTIQPWQLSSSLLNPTVNSFTGDGTTTSFTLSLPPASANTVVVTVNGITQSPVTNYSTNNTSLVFTSAPSNASVIRAVQQAMIGTSIVPIDGSVTTSKLGSSLTLSGNTSFSGAISGTSATLSSTLGVTGVTTLTAQPILSSLTASSAVATDASKGLVSVTNTGSGNNVLSASPTLTGTVAAASLSLSSLTSGRVTYAGASGLLSDSANFTYNGTLLSVSATGSSATTLAQFRQLITGVNTGDARITVGNEVYNPLIIGQNAGSSGFTYGSVLDTFFVNSANGSMLFGTNNTVKATLNASGNLGLGVTPSATGSNARALQLTNYGTLSGNGNLGFMSMTANAYESADNSWNRVNATSAGRYQISYTGEHSWYYTGSSTAGSAISWTQAMTLDASGNLLVGTTTALSRLTTSRSAGAAGAVNGQIAMTHDTATTAYYISTIRADATNEPAGLTFKENATERMRIDASGNVGIGTSSPANKLDVYTNSAATYAARIFNNNAYGGLFLQTSSVSSSIYNLACYNSASYLFVVRDDGNVGIGTSSPSSKLDVESSAAQTLVRIISTDTGGRIWNIGSLATASGLGTGGSFVFRDSTQGNTQLQVGQYNQTVSLQGASPVSGTGITFPATQSASSDVNTLDDYEEGTFTASIAFGGASVGMTYDTTPTCTYTKIGRQVTFTGRVGLSSKGSSTGDATITGLPFTPANTGNAGYGAATLAFGAGTTFSNIFQGVIVPNSTAIVLQEVTEAGVNSTLTNADFSNSSNLLFSGAYFI